MRRIFIFALATLMVFAPLPVMAQFGPIVPEECRSCPCGFGGVLAIIQNLVNFIIALAVIFATIIIAWGGFLYILSPANPGNRSLANKMLINAAIGLVITLSAWLIVDFVMKTLYGGQHGPWNSILYGQTSGNSCITVTKDPKKLFSGGIFSTPGAGDRYTPNETSYTPTSGPHPDADGRFTYQSGIENQVIHASPRLRQLMSCMAERVPANVGNVSSISDSRIVNGSKTFEQCRQGGQSAGCAHSAYSCHYGGRCTGGNSYAVDFGDEQNADSLRAAALACGADFINFEGTHLHVSIGRSAGCQCN